MGTIYLNLLISLCLSYHPFLFFPNVTLYTHIHLLTHKHVHTILHKHLLTHTHVYTIPHMHLRSFLLFPCSYKSIFMPVPNHPYHYNYNSSWMLWYLQLCSYFSGFLWVFLVMYSSVWILAIFFLHLWNKKSKFC